jgi:hypothetical protein
MTRTKLGLLGLCAVVFGLMAFNAAAVQAEPGAQWLLAEKEPNSGLIPFLEAEVGLKKDKEILLVLHAKLSGGTEFLVLCKNLEAIGIKLIAGGSTSSGQVKFTGCVVDLNGVESPACKPNDAVGGSGTVITKKGHGLIVLHILKPSGEKDENILLLPDVGKIFATLELGAECSVGSKVNVIGEHFIIEDCEHLFLKHLVEHLIQENKELSLLWIISETEEHKASILGSAWAFLQGKHEGLKFSGDPA